jgi:hypothetical protein
VKERDKDLRSKRFFDVEKYPKITFVSTGVSDVDATKTHGKLNGQLTIHADRGSSMRSKPVAFLLADLSVTKTHSRPYTSNDNPFSESQFRTLKYRPEFPDRFGSIQDSRAFCHTFFPWYNDHHRHSGIGMMTPAMVHYGLAPAIRQNRQLVLDAAYAAHPDRFVRKPPVPLPFPRRSGSTNHKTHTTILTNLRVGVSQSR